MSRAFNCDLCVQHDIIKIIQLLNIECAVETGTYKAETTLFFADMLKLVKTIEITEDHQNMYKMINEFKKNIIFYRAPN